jgi:uncharacterized protein (TIGR03118 family)
MKRHYTLSGLQFSIAGSLMLGAILLASCRKFDAHNPFLKHFAQVNLVDNNHQYGAPNTDAAQINSWGIAFSPNGIAWVNSQGGHVSALYDREGATVRPAVNIPSPGGPTGGNPTGIVFNGSSDFVLSNGAAARFIFVGVDGVLSGWNQQSGDNAELIKDNSETSAYTGLTLDSVDGNKYLYAADFRANKIAVWDGQFEPVTSMSFNDPEIPAGYAPFNVQSVEGWLYVTYAKVAENGEEEKGDGLGYVSIFKPNGDLVGRFASKGALNAPWGVAKAPAGFFSGVEKDWADSTSGKHMGAPSVLIGNFGDGYINVYTANGIWLGTLKSRGKPIQIEGLWAITFPPATSDIDPDRLYFAAGPNDEADGLFGYIIKQ